jgi:predicted xylose isomerase-like sugar epimerase
MLSLDSEHQKIVEEIIESLKNHKKNIGGDDIIMNENEKDVKALAEKYGIKINRVLMSKERHKGYNKCKDND